MVDPTDGVTRQLALTALDALVQRHRVIAQNIAHHDSVGFRPMRLEFEQFLAPVRDALAAGARGDQVSALIEQARSQVAVVPAPGDGVVRLDEEVGALAQNTLQYQALLTALGKLGALKRLAINGGEK